MSDFREIERVLERWFKDVLVEPYRVDGDLWLDMEGEEINLSDLARALADAKVMA